MESHHQQTGKLIATVCLLSDTILTPTYGLVLVADLIESTGVSVTNKGSFYDNCKDPGPDDPPKFHLVKMNDEMPFWTAVCENKRILPDASTAALKSESGLHRAGTVFCPG